MKFQLLNIIVNVSKLSLLLNAIIWKYNNLLTKDTSCEKWIEKHSTN